VPTKPPQKREPEQSKLKPVSWGSGGKGSLIAKRKRRAPVKKDGSDTRPTGNKKPKSIVKFCWGGGGGNLTTRRKKKKITSRQVEKFLTLGGGEIKIPQEKRQEELGDGQGETWPP